MKTLVFMLLVLNVSVAKLPLIEVLEVDVLKI